MISFNPRVSNCCTAFSPTPFSFVFATQSGIQPPTFTILTGRRGRPHFAYARYLENSLRERFGLRVSPVVIRFRHRPARGKR